MKRTLAPLLLPKHLNPLRQVVFAVTVFDEIFRFAIPHHLAKRMGIDIGFHGGVLELIRYGVIRVKRFLFLANYEPFYSHQEPMTKEIK